MRKPKIILLFLFVLFILIFSLLIIGAESSIAYWTREYCLYNAGAGSYACDSGQVANSNTASCNAANGVQCAEEGNVYCYAQSSCELGGVSSQGPTNAYNVNWDTDSADCTCKVGAGKWSIGGEIDATACCGDDANQFKITRTCSSGCSSDGTDDACCNANNKCVYSSTCYNQGNYCSPWNSNAIGSCSSGSWSLVEDCTTKASTDSDGGNMPRTAGTVTDYNGCSAGSCTSSQYSDTCTSPTQLTEYYNQGSSYNSQAYSCTDFEVNAVDSYGDDSSHTETCTAGLSAACSGNAFTTANGAGSGTDTCTGTCGVGINSCQFVEYYPLDSADACPGVDSCTSKNYDADTNSNTCNTCGRFWNIGGETDATACCGDDSNQFKIATVGGTDAPSGFSTNPSDDACCDSNNKCVISSSCLVNTGTSGVIPNKAYCNAGTWEGGDAGSTQCNAIAGAGAWNIGGEVDATACCGDDSNQFKITRTCSSGCSSDGTDDACCNANNKCVYSSTCYTTASKICNGNIVINCNAGTWEQNQDCDSSDGWYGGGNTAGCGDDPSSERREYGCVAGSCTYSVPETKDCDSSDVCGNTCQGTAIYSYQDYFVNLNTNQCNFTLGSFVEDCAAKNTLESDGGINYLTNGYVLDYTGCSAGSCFGTSYNDSCGGDTLTEYYANGVSYSQTTKNCNDYDNNTCWCTAGASLNEVCDNWNCGGGKCQDSGSDLTRNTWSALGLCAQQSCQGTTYRDYHTNAGSSIWGLSAEPTETACNDGYDNDCDGEWDYDTLDRGPAGNIPPHGELSCAVGITAIALFAQQKCPGETVEVECTSSVAAVNSIDAVLDANDDGVYSESEKCNFIGWNGNKANFTCNVGISVGVRNVNCSVNTAKSYKSGTDKITQISVGGTGCCAGYANQSPCNADAACDWCPECSGTKYSGNVDRCVSAGNCSYYCWSGKCGASCDTTQGGCIGAQTCEVNCSCSSGSCNPDSDKLCCDNEIGYLPTENVSQPIFNFDNTCPPNETCFDVSWLFEAGTGSCCGDDQSEFWKIMNCSSGCLNNLTDEACCNNANDCVSGGSCYSNTSCYLSGLYCDTGRWHDNDDSKLYCDTCAGLGLWNIGGDLAGCCNDTSEYKLGESGATDGTDSDACCNANDKCVDDDSCYATGFCHDTGSTASADEYCDAGAWHDNDDSPDYCNACVGFNRWALSGETAQTSCCGDDADEFYAGPSNGRSCDGTSSACCNSSFKYSNNGQCVLSCTGGFAAGRWFFLGLGPEGLGESKLKFEISDNNNPLSIITNNELALDRLYHIAVTFNNTNKEAKIFVNGRLVKSGTINRDITLMNDLGYLIGHTDFSFNGTIDEVKVYNRILEEEEIKRRYEYDKQVIYGEIPRQNEARSVKAGAKDANRGEVAPIVRIGNKEKICDITSTVDLPKCTT